MASGVVWAAVMVLGVLGGPVAASQREGVPAAEPQAPSVRSVPGTALAWGGTMFQGPLQRLVAETADAAEVGPGSQSRPELPDTAAAAQATTPDRHDVPSDQRAVDHDVTQ